jgi:hypothetical protein
MMNLKNIEPPYLWGFCGFVCFSLLLSVYLWGVSAGTSAARVECEQSRRPLLEEVTKLSDQRDALSVELTMTKAQSAADCALNCEAICASEVTRALEDASAWGCQ